MLSQGPITCFLLRRLRVDVVSDLMTFLLPVVADLTHLLLQRKISPKSPKMFIPGSPSLDLSSQYIEPILRGDVTWTLWPPDLHATSVRNHTEFQILQLQNSHSWSRVPCKGVSKSSLVHPDGTDCCLGTFPQVAHDEPHGIRAPRV